MSRCELTKKGPVVKKLVSHSNIKTASVDQPNVQKKRLFSNYLNRMITLNVATSTLRSMEQAGGLDNYILRQPSENLSKRALAFRNQIKARISAKSKKAKVDGGIA